MVLNQTVGPAIAAVPSKVLMQAAVDLFLIRSRLLPEKRSPGIEVVPLYWAVLEWHQFARPCNSDWVYR